MPASPLGPATRTPQPRRPADHPDLIDAWQRWAPEAPDQVNPEIVVISGDEPGEPPHAGR
ncbi:hypothetical protein ACWGH8_39875 [Nonomuraea muscovyensis]|uniref:Uncharacterized protein n=1 Tax=Nonomuraea muscovyensis TaxID=1124761 RepID=A0A7X0C6K5_9ACTN|nr:hypothetical protein [Nonomuraea muscovyensis]MBB6347714.1 hypothetical protein [Nonomuraea muscovyensis]